MKRFFYIFIAIISAINVYAYNPNYYGEDAMRYKGKILKVIHVDDPDESLNKWNRPDTMVVAYSGFYEFDKMYPNAYLGAAEYGIYNYEINWMWSNEGTRPSYLSDKCFKVINVYRFSKETPDLWIFELQNIKNPSDKCKYLYTSSYDQEPKSKYNKLNWVDLKHKSLNFPFIVK